MIIFLYHLPALGIHFASFTAIATQDSVEFLRHGGFKYKDLRAREHDC